MKSQTSILIDSDVLAEARIRKINLSGIINVYLKEYLSMKEKEKKTKNIEDMNNEIAILKSKIVEREKEIDKLNKKQSKRIILHSGR